LQEGLNFRKRLANLRAHQSGSQHESFFACHRMCKAAKTLVVLQGNRSGVVLGNARSLFNECANARDGAQREGKVLRAVIESAHE
jgi:hypothetical protein